MSQKERKTITVKATLEGKLAKKFLKIKEIHGLKSDAETVRFCVAREYKRVTREPEP